MNNLKKYDELCHSIGGIHRAIQLLDLLRYEVTQFNIYRNMDLKNTEMPKLLVQCKPFERNDKYLLCQKDGWDLWRGVLIQTIPSYVLADLYSTSEFLDWLDHKINHGVFVPENVYFQTMERIEDLRKWINKKASV